MLRIKTLWKMLALGKSSSTSSPPTRGEKEDAVQANRRRLIKGAASAPMILTLYNGAALARSSIVVTEAMTYDELFDPAKGIDEPICVIADNFEPVGGDNYHVTNGTATFMNCEELNGTHNCNANNDTQKDNLFAFYNDTCENNGANAKLIVASSSASLIH